MRMFASICVALALLAQSEAQQSECHLPKVIGPCRGYFRRFFFNSTTGSCEQFGYGGCRGNSNNFETLEDCQKTCNQKSVCSLPAVTGPCEAYFPSFFHNATTRQCESFVYGGCQGNANRFDDIKSCQKTCSVVTRDPCVHFECQNGGSCTAPADVPLCRCPPGYSGDRCQDKDAKPGTCPKVEPGSFGVCGGTFCEDDAGCPGDQKCCDSACGGQLCTAVDLGCGGCQEGHVCRQRAAPCPPGRVCILALLPTCVPEACADCRPDQECRNVTNKCPLRQDLDKPCPPFRQFCAMKGVYECSPASPCPRGQRCESFQLCQGAPQPQPRPERKRRQSNMAVSTTWDVYDPYCARESRCVPDVTTTPTPTQPPVHGLCSTVRCRAGTTCRAVAACDTCVLRARCIPDRSLQDSVCVRARYLEALMVGLSGSFRPKICPYGATKDEPCPRGSVCVDDGRGLGVCCTGKPDAVKPGTCPVIRPDSIGVCGGTFCRDDAGCPGDQKCCASACGGNLCTRVDTKPKDECGGCDAGQKCVDTGIRCIRAPCPTWQCVPDCQDRCSPDEECKQAEVQCVRAPCPPGPPMCVRRRPATAAPPTPPTCSKRCSRRQSCQASYDCEGSLCQRSDECLPKSRPRCSTRCPRDQTCRWAKAPCSGWGCFWQRDQHTAKCGPKESDLKPTCPKPMSYSRWACWVGGLFASSPARCSSHADCRPGQHCCPQSCGGRACTAAVYSTRG